MLYWLRDRSAACAVNDQANSALILTADNVHKLIINFHVLLIIKQMMRMMVSRTTMMMTTAVRVSMVVMILMVLIAIMMMVMVILLSRVLFQVFMINLMV